MCARELLVVVVNFSAGLVSVVVHVCVGARVRGSVEHAAE
jgi:hypothetical protein